MKKYFKNNKIVVLIVVFIIGIAVGNLIDLNKSKKVSLKQKKECREVGSDFHSEFKKEWEDALKAPEYIYNPELDTCIYHNSITSISNGSFFSREVIMDAITGEQLTKLDVYSGQDKESNKTASCIFNIKKKAYLSGDAPPDLTVIDDEC